MRLLKSGRLVSATIRLSLIVVVIIIAYLTYRGVSIFRQNLVTDLTQAIQLSQTSGNSLVMADVMAFTWDKFYIFGPYSSEAEIDAKLNMFWLGSRFTSITWNDRITLLVFIHDGRVIQSFEFSRARGDFVSAINEAGYEISDAIFTVDADGDIFHVTNPPDN